MAAVASKKKATKAAPKRNHVALADAWAKSVLDGTFPCGQYMRLAVERQQRDLTRIGRPDFPYVFDPKVGAKVCRFLEQLPHTQEALASAPVGSLVTLQPWQCWWTITQYGWVRADDATIPRFERGDTFMPKGNGKTFMCAGLALHRVSTFRGGERVFSAATETKQARESFDTARQMLNLRSDLCDAAGLEVLEQSIVHRASGGSYKPLSKVASGADGTIPSFVIEDEVHLMTNRALHDTLRAGLSKRATSRMVTISTAGTDWDSVGREIYEEARDILTGRVQLDTVFAFIAEADEGDDPWDEKTWFKANPNLGVSLPLAKMRSWAEEAHRYSSRRAEFFTKRLGWWQKADRAWMDMAAWDRAADPNLKRDQFKEQPVVIGLDLASKVDMAAKALLFRKDLPGSQGDETHYYLFVDFYLNDAKVRDGSNPQYEGWVEDGYIQSTPGNVTDFRVIKSDILEDREEYAVAEVAVDIREASQLASDLTEQGLRVTEVVQQAKYLSEPMKELEAAVLSGRFHHDGNPVMRWMVSNVECHPDKNNNLFPNKLDNKLTNKIDGVSATITALARQLLSPSANKDRPHVWSFDDFDDEDEQQEDEQEG